MAYERIQNEIDVKKIMSGIREKIQQDKAKKQTWEPMFDQEIDVAMVMRNIKNNCNNEKSCAENSGAFNLTLDEIYLEIERINEFVDGTRNLAMKHVEPGCVIPVNTSRPVIIQKVLTLCKRLVRKATRFLVLDQMTFNVRINECIKALCEAQEQNLKLVRVIEQLYQRDVQLQSQMELNAKEANGKLVEARVRTTKQITQLTSIIDEVRGKDVELRERIATYNQDVANRIKEIEQLMRNLKNDLAEGDGDAETLTDELYVQFENEFRGTESEVKVRLAYYLSEYVEKTIRKKESDIVLDLGCGRGEWLELLKETGYICKGVDCNPEMISLCSSKGLNAEQGDVLDYLRSLEDCSVKMITGFQIAEHLPMQKLQELMKEAYRVLEYHGMLILETPNCRNVEVGSANFYTDPTHNRPLHPDYMQFLARTTGFYETDIAMWKQAEIQAWLDSVIEADGTDVMQSPVVRTMLESMKSILYNSPDYAMIAIK